MVDYYVTKGKLKMKNGEATIFVGGKSKALTQSEFVLWTCLHWSIMNKESLNAEFDRKLKKYHIYNDISFEQTLNRLKTRELIACGSDYLAVDALYNLVKALNIVPLGTVNGFKRIFTFFYMHFVKGVPFGKCHKTAQNLKSDEFERKIIRFTKRVNVSTAELIRIYERNLWNVKYDEEIVPIVYGEDEDLNALGDDARFSDSKTKVLEAVVNLYLRKQIIFE